jgi:hypothetical protein
VHLIFPPFFIFQSTEENKKLICVYVFEPSEKVLSKEKEKKEDES